MIKELMDNYNKLFEKYKFSHPIEVKNLNSVIKLALIEFLKKHKNVALYCNGGHTRMLMADFMYELKNVHIIIDNYADYNSTSGFKLIKDSDINKEAIDGIIISSYKFRNDIIKNLNEKHSGIEYLDIYEECYKNNIELQTDYYYYNHPYQYYHTINDLQIKIDTCNQYDEKQKLVKELISNYIKIKDFKTAIHVVKKMNGVFDEEYTQNLIDDLEEIYRLEQRAAKEIDEDNVVMLCFDGLRRTDLFGGGMPQLHEWLKKVAALYTNSYSYSTSTYESLIPVYSDNYDMNTKYYQKNYIEGDNCKFIQKAKKQDRNIYFYTDADCIIKDSAIKYSDCFQTASEKLWNFIIDAYNEKNGLFYIHILYESHFTFSNPYTKEKLISEGTAMLFDYLPQKGGTLRTDYTKQHNDSIRYLDDVVTPILKNIKCNMVIYADHGNLLLEKNTPLEQVQKINYCCSEQWVNIPIAIKTKKEEASTHDNLFSLSNLNNIIISLLSNKCYKDDNVEFVKIGRSQSYNPDLIYQYNAVGCNLYLQAFEGFIFSSGYKLVVFANGEVKLFSLPEDNELNNNDLKNLLLRKVISFVTVCGLNEIQIK